MAPSSHIPSCNQLIFIYCLLSSDLQGQVKNSRHSCKPDAASLNFALIQHSKDAHWLAGKLSLHLTFRAKEQEWALSTTMGKPDIPLTSADFPGPFPGQCAGRNLLFVLLQLGKGVQPLTRGQVGWLSQVPSRGFCFLSNEDPSILESILHDKQ